MKKSLMLLSTLAMALSLGGCMYWGSGTNLAQVAKENNMINVTTGDGTFENYKATGFYRGTEFGIAVGIPGMIKIQELFPVQSNEALLGRIAKSAAGDGANAMINVTPHQESYFGFPFFIVGLYVDRTEGTGIKVGK
ncbi:hypothetical protein HYR69_05620 [Candidatus Sumerlaeota bacterium]|nr:hypothetical protein [Candidatus Sumerlaeota bacterium]